MKRLSRIIYKGWALLRRLSGDDAYERYLLHRRLHHANEVPLSRADFQRQQIERHWNGVRRCC